MGTKTAEQVLRRWKSWAKDCHEEPRANPEVEIYDALAASQERVRNLEGLAQEAEPIMRWAGGNVCDGWLRRWDSLRGPQAPA